MLGFKYDNFKLEAGRKTRRLSIPQKTGTGCPEDMETSGIRAMIQKLETRNWKLEGRVQKTFHSLKNKKKTGPY